MSGNCPLLYIGASYNQSPPDSLNNPAFEFNSSLPFKKNKTIEIGVWVRNHSYQEAPEAELRLYYSTVFRRFNPNNTHEIGTKNLFVPSKTANDGKTLFRFEHKFTSTGSFCLLALLRHSQFTNCADEAKTPYTTSKLAGLYQISVVS
jgi:hypothetical protein